MLIVEDDPAFSSVLLEAAHEKGFKGIVAARGSEALDLARRHRVDAITLDIRLPDIDGWRVLNRLKDDPATRHIPVQILSSDDTSDLGLKNGALSHMTKPIQPERLEEMITSLKNFVSRPVKNLLVVEDNEVQRQNTVELIGGPGVNTFAVGSGKEGLEALKEQHFDCVVLDLGLPDMTGAEFIDEVKKAGFHNLPIVVHTAKDLHREEAQEIKRMARTVILKDVQSPERLFDETALFLHRPVSTLPDDKRKLVENLHRNDDVIAGKRVLIVDDDMRNIFAMTSFLERYNMTILSTESGAEAIEILKHDPGDRCRAHGYHDARPRWLRDDAPDPRNRPLQRLADHRAHRESDERRPREVHRSRRFGLHCEAGGHRALALAPPYLAPSLIMKPSLQHGFDWFAHDAVTAPRGTLPHWNAGLAAPSLTTSTRASLRNDGSLACHLSFSP